MRWLVAVALAACGACGGADDGGDVFGADAGTTTYGPSGLPNCETTCGADHRVECAVPGKTKDELSGMYDVTETDTTGPKPIVSKPEVTYEDGAVRAYCWAKGDKVTFTAK